MAVLSDLHVGPRPARASFGHDPADFGRWLTRLEATHDRIVLAGDIFQTDHLLWPSSVRRLRALRQAHDATPEIARRFARAPYQYLHGNHDEIAATTGVPDRVRLEHAGLAVLVTHGHQFDPIARRAPWAALAGTTITGALRGARLTVVAAALEARDIAIKHGRFGGPEGPYARGAGRLARDAGAAIVVLGHTHVAELFTIGTVVYANAGTCSGGRREYVSIDLAQGWVESRQAVGAEEIVRRLWVPRS